MGPSWPSRVGAGRAVPGNSQERAAPQRQGVQGHGAVNENASIPACGWYERRRSPATPPYVRDIRPRTGTAEAESCAFRIEFGRGELLRRRRGSSRSDRLFAAPQREVQHRDRDAGLRTTRSQRAVPPRHRVRREPVCSLVEKVHLNPATHFFPTSCCRRAGIQSFTSTLDLRRPRLFHIVPTLVAFRIETGNQPSGDLSSVLFWKFQGVLEYALCG